MAKENVKTSDYLDINEYRRLLRELEYDGKYKWCMFCILSFSLGLRFSDVSRIKWKDVYNQDEIIVKEQKTGKVRVIPIGESVKKTVYRMFVFLNKPDINDFVFKSNFDDKPVSKQYTNRKLKEFKKKYNLRIGNISTHTFRKTFGRYIYEKMGRSEESLIYLNQIFKHSSLRTTMVYICVRKEEINSLFMGIDLYGQ